MEIESCGSRIPRVGCHRDFPPGCGIVSNSSLKGASGLKSVHHYRRDFPPGCGPNGPETADIGPVKRLGSGRDSGSGSDSTNWRRPVTATKSKPPLGGKMVMKVPQKEKGKEPQMGGKLVIRIPNKMGGKLEMKIPQKVKEKEAVGSGSGLGQREKVLEMLRLFRERCEKISTSGQGIRRVDIKASAELQEEGKIMYEPALMIGSVPGVEVGDKFYYRIELKIVGLHRLLQAGIDYMDSGRWGKLATCIVANERHLDKMNDPNVLTYVGEGGSLPRHEVGMPPDQLLKGGNLALWNSMKEKKPVRVVRGLSLDGGRIVYVYDGLYEVKDCEKKKGPQGNMIFQFQLLRCPGQPAVPWKTCRWARF